MTTVWTECEFAPSSPGIRSLRVWPDGVRRAGACVRFFLMVDLANRGVRYCEFRSRGKKVRTLFIDKAAPASATALYVHF